MGRKRSPGLRNRSGIRPIEKQILGCKIHESTGSSNLEEAELNLAAKLWRDENGLTWLDTPPQR